MSTEKPVEPAKPMKREEGVVYIGQKPVMNYVIACLPYFNVAGKEVCVKARGMAISKAVDTIEVLRRNFVKGLVIKNIKLGTEEVQREQGKSNVSIIEITAYKPEEKK